LTFFVLESILHHDQSAHAHKTSVIHITVLQGFWTETIIVRRVACATSAFSAFFGNPHGFNKSSYRKSEKGSATFSREESENIINVVHDSTTTGKGSGRACRDLQSLARPFLVAVESYLPAIWSIDLVGGTVRFYQSACMPTTN